MGLKSEGSEHSIRLATAHTEGAGLAGDREPTIISAEAAETVAAFKAASLEEQATAKHRSYHLLRDTKTFLSELNKLAESPAAGPDAQRLADAAARLAKDVAIYAGRIEDAVTPELQEYIHDAVHQTAARVTGGARQGRASGF